MLKPVGSLIYFYYRCSKCREKSDAISVKRVKVGGPLVCEFCGNVDQIAPISKMTVRYGKTPKQTTSPKATERSRKRPKVKKVSRPPNTFDESVSALKALGFTKAEAVKLVENVPLDISETSDIVKWVLKKKESSNGRRTERKDT